MYELFLYAPSSRMRYLAIGNVLTFLCLCSNSMAEEPAEETFESADAGSSHTYPMEGGQIRKGGYIMIKGRPCKVTDVSTSKTGKHGHAKCHFVAADIFTGKKMEVIPPPFRACHFSMNLHIGKVRPCVVLFICPSLIAGSCSIVPHH